MPLAGTIFVYGQTGAGKTHTMDAFTHLVLQQLYTAAARDDSNCEISITVSAVELYNEVLRCLLSGRENLQLRMGAGPGPGAASGVVLEGADERVSAASCACRNLYWPHAYTGHMLAGKQQGTLQRTHCCWLTRLTVTATVAVAVPCTEVRKQ
jgi:hypothetical protein